MKIRFGFLTALSALLTVLLLLGVIFSGVVTTTALRTLMHRIGCLIDRGGPVTMRTSSTDRADSAEAESQRGLSSEVMHSRKPMITSESDALRNAREVIDGALDPQYDVFRRVRYGRVSKIIVGPTWAAIPFEQKTALGIAVLLVADTYVNDAVMCQFYDYRTNRKVAEFSPLGLTE